MHNSTIKRKPCKCGCGKLPKLGYKGYAGLGCIPQEIKDADPEKFKIRSISHRKYVKINDISRKVHMYQKNILDEETLKKRVDLERWFISISKEISKKPYCWECGAFISNRFYRHATAHIFPKTIFKSVSTNPMNYLILGAGCGCHEKTHRLDNFSKMKIFSEAVRRFMIFQKEIQENHKYKTIFESYIK